MSDGVVHDALGELLGVDKLIHEPARLSILALLRVVKRADFVFLQSQTGLTAGNISSHLGKLAGAGYVEVEKGFLNNRPRTLVKLSAVGRVALRRYLQTMGAVLQALDG
ncbi:MAG: transcriptional regulator [Nannocystaceae bacterium]|nr:transcriptional regulator [Myxococcales bacterium]